MSGQLNAQGVVGFFSDKVGQKLTTMNMGWPAVFGLLNAVYFGLHYIFASQTAHVGALYAAFLAMMTASGETFARECRLAKDVCVSRSSDHVETLLSLAQLLIMGLCR